MPEGDSPPRETTAPALPSDELVLAALERAGRHQGRDSLAVPMWTILEHLALPRRSAGARHVAARLAVMDAAGWLERSRRHGVSTWELAGAGARELRRARRAGDVPELPESPQHRAWRLARVAALQEIERFRTDVGERLGEATALLDGDAPPHSDAWLELAEQLQRACRRLASASYCLYEWAEPDDAHADIDEHAEATDTEVEPHERARRRARRAGRRNVRLWEERSGG
jgi:hypothetical protein